VLVKRPICIEDLGDVTVLCTDKTGSAGSDGGVAFFAHVGGFLFGFLVTPLGYRRSRSRRAVVPRGAPA
jgi:membrane associated rhomboid family serine protease